MSDIAPIKGLIELQDDFTSRLGLAEAALGNFTKQNQESLKAVAGVAGLVTAAFGATAAAVIELGKRGADVNDVRDTVEHFAGSAHAAAADIEALRQGTKNTVDDFILAKDAAHLLSAGIQLTADDFGVLGQAAFVLQNRGLGGTKEQLDLVSEAMVTGRTRALSMALGVVDVTDAQGDFAKSIGLTKDQLNEAGKAEANRIAVMKILQSAVKDAGQQERDFGEEFEAGQAAITNWFDELGSQIAKSETFKVGFKAIEDAVSSAFSNDKGQSIKTVTSFIEQGAIAVIGFGQVAITMAKGFESAWYVVKTIVLGVEGAIVAAAELVIGYVDDVARSAASLHVISQSTAESVDSLKANITGMRQSFDDQITEAAKAVVGHTALDDTFDKLSDTLGKVKAAMITTHDQTQKNTDATDKATDSNKKLGQSSEDLQKKFGDQDKIQKELEKSTRELAKIWDDYYAEVAKNSGTTADEQQADIEATFRKNVDTLDKLDPLYAQKYAAYRAIADESLKGIASDWNSVRDTSLEALQQQADKAKNTYDQMLDSGLTFSRDVLDAQRQKWLDLEDAVRNYGDTAISSVGNVVNEMDELIKQMDAAYEASKKLTSAGQFDVTKDNFAKTIHDIITDYGYNPTGIGSKIDPNFAGELAKQGYSLQEILNYFNTGTLSPTPAGPRIPGFAEGGIVMVGERGPEAVRLPSGSQVYPTGTGPGGTSISIAPGAIQINYPMMNDPRAKDNLARLVGDAIMERARAQGKRFD
jgi:hypothetical protein